MLDLSLLRQTLRFEAAVARRDAFA